MDGLSAETAQRGTLLEGDVLFLARHDGTQPIALDVHHRQTAPCVVHGDREGHAR